jgi:hypothetical protein
VTDTWDPTIELSDKVGWRLGCGVRARLHERRPTWVRDLPAARRPVTLVRVERAWRCVEPRCENGRGPRRAKRSGPRAAWTEGAGVAVETVYAAFSNKATLLRQA